MLTDDANTVVSEGSTCFQHRLAVEPSAFAVFSTAISVFFWYRFYWSAVFEINGSGILRSEVVNVTLRDSVPDSTISCALHHIDNEFNLIQSTYDRRMSRASAFGHFINKNVPLTVFTLKQLIARQSFHFSSTKPCATCE